MTSLQSEPQLDLSPFQWEDTMAGFVRERLRGSQCKPTGVTRSLYLDLAERLTRACLRYQREDGRVIDPLSDDVEDRSTATPRLVAAIAPLVRAGRCLDLVSAAGRTMDYATKRLVESSNTKRDLVGPDFYTRDLAIGWRWLRGHVEQARAAAWAERLGAFEPEDVYWQTVRTMDPAQMCNVAIYSATGEFLKTRFGLADETTFVERQLNSQMPRFDANGMYRDPGCPILYDLTVRQGLSWMLFWGYDGTSRERMSELLRRGGLMSLFCQSPTGEMPYGGRSNQYQHNEAMACFIFEFEARRHAARHDMPMACAFKRAARRAAMATIPWVFHCDPPRSLKNAFPIESGHGQSKRDCHAVYGLLAANLFGLAHHIADETIAEAVTPSEAGGYVLPLGEDFHRILVGAGGYGIEVDLAAQQTHDATGLGRVHRLGIPTWIGLSCPIAAHPRHVVPADAQEIAACIGPAWQGADGHWRSLAETSQEHCDCAVEILAENAQTAELRVTYHISGSSVTVVEEYACSAEGVCIRSQVLNCDASKYRFVVPLSVTDGQHPTQAQALRAGLRARCSPHEFDARCSRPADVGSRILPQVVANQNGIYALGVFESGQPEFDVRIQMR